MLYLETQSYTSDHGYWSWNLFLLIWSNSFFSEAKKKQNKKSDSLLGCQVVVQSLNNFWLFATPWSAALQAFLLFTNSWSSPNSCPLKVMLSNHLIQIVCVCVCVCVCVYISIYIYIYLSIYIYIYIERERERERKIVIFQSPNYPVMSDSIWPHGLEHTKLPCTSISPGLLRFICIASVMASSHLTLWHPLLILPSIFPRIRDFSTESSGHIKWPKSWSFSYSISPSSEYSGLISLNIDCFDVLADQGIFRHLL